MERTWGRLDRPTRVALVTGVVLAIAAIPLPTLGALAVGLAAAVALGYAYPSDATRVGVTVAVPVLAIAFLVGMLRGFSVIVLAVFLACSLILPVASARLGAIARVGNP